MKKITLYLCSKCGEEYRRKSFCLRHEAKCFSRGCDECKHGRRLVDGTISCLMLMRKEDCKFELREQSK